MNATKKLKFSVQPDTGTLSEQDARRYFTVVGVAVFALILLYQAVAVVLSLAIGMLAPALFDHAVVMHVVNLIPLYGVGLPVFCLILRRLPKGVPSGEPMGAGRFFGGFGLLVAMMMAGNYVGTALNLVFEALLNRPQSNPVADALEGVPIWVNLIFVVLVPAVMEELLFRKILCDRLLPLGEGCAIVISSAAFALGHGNFFQVFYAFGLGLVLGAVYVKTGKLWICMIYHGLVNLIFGVVSSAIVERITPLLEEETLNRMTEYMETENLDALVELLTPYLIPALLLLVYEFVVFGFLIGGIVYYFVSAKKIRYEKGLLPLPQKGRVAAVLLNPGTAAAIAVFAVVFLLSLL